MREKDIDTLLTAAVLTGANLLVLMASGLDEAMATVAASGACFIVGYLLIVLVRRG
jgi:hypothetical protein